MKNKRLREFQPEPLIDPSETVVDATDIELWKPDEVRNTEYLKKEQMV